MVRAILAGTKTQTRRVVKDRHIRQIDTSKLPGPAGWSRPMPYGQPGDRLWVRETCLAEELPDGLDGVRYLADEAFLAIESTPEGADRWLALRYYGKRPSPVAPVKTVPAIHMPRWASRITLEVTGVRVERLQDISEADALAEGSFSWAGEHDTPVRDLLEARLVYRQLWESINGPGSWDANPWVWAAEFKRVKP